MRVTVNTPTGKIGSQVAEVLLASGHQLTVIHRQPQRLTDLTQRGVQVIAGSADDPAVVEQAVRDAESVLWVTPSNYAAPDDRAASNAFGDAAVRAFAAHNTQRVVNVSSVGANLAAGTGPIAGLHDIERKFNSVVPNVVHLRPTYFMENFLHHIPEIASSGNFYLPVNGDVPLPMIATRDIAQDAARRLVDRNWRGQLTQHLLGPADLTMNQAAEQLGTALGRELRYVQVTPDQAREGMLVAGMSPVVADTLLEMYAWLSGGLSGAELERSPLTNTATTFAQFARDVFKPAYSRAQHHTHGTG